MASENPEGLDLIAFSEDFAYDSASFELIHSGVEGYSKWTGDSLIPTQLDTLELDVLVSIRNPTGRALPSERSLARLSVQASATSAPAATWTWYTLPYTDSWSFDTTANACGVNVKSLYGAAPAPWSNEAMLYGTYSRTLNNSSPNLVIQEYGGACLMDLDTGALTMVVDPRTNAASVSAVAPHPQVADVWALLPELSAVSWGECSDAGDGVANSAITALSCAYPYPMLIQGNANGWQTTTMNTGYPNTMPLTASWSPLGVADDSTDGTGSWLVVGTGGSGTWRGEMTW